MEGAARLAGYFAAHAVWCVSDGDTLTPILAYETRDGGRMMERLVMESNDEAIKEARRRVQAAHDFARAVIIYDGYVTLASGKTDALIIEATECESPARGFEMVLPYRHAKSDAGFAVHKPKLTDISGVHHDEIDPLVVAFFEAVHTHEQGAGIWDAHLDESV